MPEVVFLPGFMQHADAWSQIAAAVGERYPSKIHDFETWTFDERIAEIEAAAGEDAVLVGYSMGGRLALHAALRRPRYSGLVLLGASAGIADDAARARRLGEDAELAAWIERHSIAEVVERWERNPVFASQSPALVDEQRPGRLRHDPPDLARLLRSAGQGASPVVWDRLGELRMPVLAIAGESDATYREAGRRIASLVPNGRAEVVPGAGHAAHMEQPHAFTDLLLDWLGGAFGGHSPVK
jgi:2-succinyl-6-hydroxy-2,4-cyclohexadiene-1-carboxylate synthase